MLTALVVTGVIVVIGDDVGWDLHRAAPTPNLDRMAQEGRVYHNFWGAPKCASSRAQFLTGLEPHRPENLIGDGPGSGLPDSDYLLPSQVTVGCFWAGKLHVTSEARWPVESAGFLGFFGTLANLPKSKPSNDGSFYDWTETSYEVGDWGPQDASISEYATAVVARRLVPAGVMVLAFHDAHAPFQLPPDYMAPISYAAGLNQGSSEYEVVLAKVEAMDTAIGWVMDVARKDGSLVLYFADNGSNEAWGGGKGSLYESGLNVPLIVWGPGVETGESRALVQVTDLNSTIAQVVGRSGTRVPQDSISFYDEMSGMSPDSARQVMHSGIFAPSGTPPKDHKWDRAVRDKRWKLIHFGTNNGKREFYDLYYDPDEMFDLLSQGWMSPEQEEAYLALSREVPR